MEQKELSRFESYTKSKEKEIEDLKRDIIDIDNDEAKREQPAEKIAKKETGSVPSPDVAQLQQQLLKSDEKYKRICEMAGKYKARVEFLENIIDTKEGIVANANREESTDELRKKVAELTKKLEEREARERIEHSQQTIAVMQPPPDVKPIINGSGHPINILQSCDPNAPSSMPFNIARDILHALYAKCSLDSLVNSCDTVKSETNNCDTCGKEIIGVTNMFHHFFSKEHAEKMLGRSISEAAVKYWRDKLEQSNTIAPIDIICHPTNILQSCDSTTPESISYFVARSCLVSRLTKCDMELLLALCANELFECQECGENNLDANQVFIHFLSTEHTVKMSGRNVSLAATSYWKEKLIRAESVVTIHNVCHPTNIFQLCSSDAPGVITIDSARNLLKRFIGWRGFGYLKALGHEKQYCEVCKTNSRLPGGLGHAFTQSHILEAAAIGADSISLTAVNYWIQLFSTREEFSAFRQDLNVKRKDKKAAKKTVAEAQKHRVQPDPAVAAEKRAEEAVNAAITAAAVAAANKVAMELRIAAQNRQVQPDPAVADEVKKEIVKVEND